MKVVWNNKKWMKDNFLKEWGKFSAICYKTNTEKVPPEKIAKHCLKAGHYSGCRHLMFNFTIEDIPRSAADQLVRKQQGAHFNMQSWRYVNIADNGYSAMPLLYGSKEALKIYEEHMELTRKNYQKIVDEMGKMGITGERANEAARGIVGMDFHTSLNCSLSLESLIDLANKRLCVRSQAYIRTLFEMIVKEVREEMPELASLLVPQCVAKGYCPEGKDCRIKVKQ